MPPVQGGRGAQHDPDADQPVPRRHRPVPRARSPAERPPPTRHGRRRKTLAPGVFSLPFPSATGYTQAVPGSSDGLVVVSHFHPALSCPM
jgi:hypothetical protein